MPTPYEQFLSDPGRQEIWLLEIDVRDTVNSVDRTLYFSSQQYGTGPYDTPPHRAYKACITRGFEFSAAVEQLSTPVYGLMPSRQGGSIVLGQVLGDLDLGTFPALAGVPLRQYAFAGREARVLHGGLSPALGRMLAYDEFKQVFTGELDGQPSIGESSVTVFLRSKDARFQYPISKRTYYGCQGAILFPSASGGEVDCGTDSAFDFTSSPFSWEFVLYPEANAASTETLICYGVVDTYGYRIDRLTTGALRFSTYQSGATQHTISDPITPQFHNRYTVRLTGSTAQILENNVDITATAGVHVAPASVVAGTHLYFGRNNTGAQILKNCLLTDIRCWSAYLSDDQITSRMHRPLDTTEYSAANLIAYWPANDGNGTALDQKVVALGAAGDGTLSGGAVFAPSLLGGVDLQGEPLPQAWGPFDGFEPVPVDVSTQIHQVHSGSVSLMDKVYIGGGAATTLDNSYTSVIDFLDSATVPGKHDTCIVAGGSYVRFGGAPSHPVTVGGEGDNTGGTYRETASDIVRFVACNTGWYPLTDPTDLDTSSFTDLLADAPAPVGLAYKGEMSVSSVINFFLQSVGAVGFFRRETDLFSVLQIKDIDDAATPTRTITEEDIDGDEISVLEDNTPAFRVNLQYKHNYRELSITELFEGVAGTDREKFVRKEWRKASQPDTTTKINYPAAVTILYDTGFFNWFDAMTEAARQLQIHKHVAQGYKFKVKQGKTEFDRFDTVYFDYADRDVNFARQNRFGSGPTRKMYVLDVADDADTGGSIITVWRNKV